MIQECAKYRVKLNNNGDESGNEVIPFEMVVLDNALNATASKFTKNLSRQFLRICNKNNYYDRLGCGIAQR